MPDARLRIIKSDRIFSPTGGYTGQKFIVIENDIIKTLSAEMPVHYGAEVIDFAGFSITPLFCDYHLHFTRTASADSDVVDRALLGSGIQKVFEGGDRHLSGLAMQQRLNNRIEVRTSGYALFKKGTYGRHIGHEVEGPDDAREAVDHLCNCGVDYIKLINSGILMPGTGKITPGGFDQEELYEIIGYIKERGLECFCHANGEGRIKQAVLAGASAIIHGFYISDEVLELMSENETAFIPTVNAFACLSEMIPAHTRQNWEKSVGRHLIMVKRAGEKGVKLLPGSDSGPGIIPYGIGYLRELQFFRDAGLPLDDILSSACIDDLKEGIRADFLVLDGLDVKKIFISGEQPKQ
jgi:imidazolonepropionase-like amidohydrolase